MIIGEGMARASRKKDYTPTIDAELDLHGYYADEARREVRAFLAEARDNDWSRVCIVVGKGTHSVGGQAVLPPVVKAVLDAEGYPYTYAKVTEGGEGALIVSL